jgi:metal-responsive CopG/Arc/MetJ family transcriptional regulator
MPTGILRELDDLVEKKPWLNRTQWIVEAIHDQLKRCLYEG